jgi:tRNA-dihydrouridine synthase A
MHSISHKICLAPMMKYTDRYYRFLMRLISHHVYLYTEMIPAKTILYTQNKDRFLAFDPIEHPVAIQLGGNDPTELAACAKLAAQYHYDEINLNVGCPSPSVQAGQFGICLMNQPKKIAECVLSIREAVDLPISIKTRLGIQDETTQNESLNQLIELITQTAVAGCKTFMIHARYAHLNRSPKANRSSLSTLRYDSVYNLKNCFKNLEIILNGEIKTLSDIGTHLAHVDGVMIGKEAYRNPYFLALADQKFFQDNHPVLSREEIFQSYLNYIHQQLSSPLSADFLLRHLYGLFKGCPNAIAWKQKIKKLSLENL